MRYLAVILIAFAFFACNHKTSRTEKRLLIYSTPSSWQDSTVNVLFATLKTGLLAPSIEIDTAHSLSSLAEENIKHYSAIIILGTGMEHFDPRTQSDIERYVEAGGGFIGINSPLLHKLYWPWYNTIPVIDSTSISTIGKTGLIMDIANSGQLSALTEVIDHAIGDNAYSYDHVSTVRCPDPKRYIREVLDNNIDEPMKMAVLPDEKVLFIERRGKVKLYDPSLKSTRLIDHFDVRTDGNYEDGMLGLELDPNFEFNHWVYIYYSPANTAIHSLSRFVFLGDSLLRSSEKVVLEVPVQIETCCHSGGDVVFGPDGLLYLSTGDNTSSKESNGYTPLDERPGRSPFDAQKSSGNTNDLRGKILRIKPEADGTYSIPNGNLFPKDGSKGKPEIYLMGLRNPFRFTVHQKHNNVYWGEVGPDSGSDGKYGPRSYDEFNRAKQAGNFGWPYFQGDNMPFPDRNFETDEVGPFFNPDAPINDSPFNSGARLLPPAQKSLIWYPYAHYDKFPMLGTGSRSAMGGPFYYADEFPENAPLKFSEYYDGKWIIYDWARSWVKIVTFDERDNMVKIEPFLSETAFHKPIDMQFGPDGSLYVLEYGANYFANNNDAYLLKIGYAGSNLAPIPTISADKTIGAAPITVNFSSEGSYDRDKGDELSYEWIFSSENVQSTEASASHTFNEPGIYNVRLIVSDQEGASGTAEMEIKVGNEKPDVQLVFKGNQSFYFADNPIEYEVSVTDKEDIEEGAIADEDVYVNFNYIEAGLDIGVLTPGTIIKPSSNLKGKALIEGSDCKSCHSLNEKSVGPTYLEVSKRYQSESNEVVGILAQKIIEGGSGNWGHSMMAAHPQHSVSETSEMVNYILSLSDQGADKNEGIAMKGTLNANRHQIDNEDGVYVFQAAYTDNGANGIQPMLTNKMIVLKHPKVRAESYDHFEKTSKRRVSQVGETSTVLFSHAGAYIAFDNVDLSQLSSATLRIISSVEGEILIKTGGVDGKIVGSTKINPGPGNSFDWNEVSITLERQSPVKQTVYITVEGDFAGQGKFLNLDWIEFKQ